MLRRVHPWSGDADRVGQALAAALVTGARLRELGESGAKLGQYLVDIIVVQVGL